MASKLKKNQKFFIDERILLDKKKVLLDTIQSAYVDQKEIVKERIEFISERAQEKLKQLKELTEKYNSSKKANEGKKVLLDIKNQMKKSKLEYNQELKNLIATSKQIISSHTKLNAETVH